MKAFSVIGECAEKSELVRRLVVVELTGRGLRVSTIKRVSDAVDLERPGSGTWKHRAAGAEEVMLASASRFVRFRRSSYPKMEVVQTDQDRTLLALDDPMVLAVTSDGPVAAPVPVLPLSDIEALADFVMAHAVASGSKAPGNRATARTSRSPPIAVGEAAELIPARGRPFGHVSPDGQVVFMYLGVDHDFGG